jgi:hypothetical protein
MEKQNFNKQNINIAKIIAREIKYKYLERVKESLDYLGMTFEDLRNYKRSGRSMNGKSDNVFAEVFGEDAQVPEVQPFCLCGQKIIEQCYLSPIDSTDPDDIIVVGNHCIKTWGFTNAIRGKGKKIECVTCGAIVNKYGLKRHYKTKKCKTKGDTLSTVSTSIGSDSL